MKWCVLLSILLTLGIVPALASTPVMVQDYEKVKVQPTVWVVNIPNENASVQLSNAHPQQGKGSLKLHYHFTGAGQYLASPTR